MPKKVQLAKKFKRTSIAIVCDPITDYMAGSFVSTLRFSELLVEKGHKIIFIAAKSPRSKDNDKHKNIKVYRFRSVLLPKTEKKFYLALPTVGQLKKIFQAEKIEVVHTIIPTPAAMIAIKAAQALKLKIVVHSHTQPENVFLHLPKVLARDMLSSVFQKYIFWFNQQAHAVIYPTKFAQNLFPPMNLAAQHVVISNGVNLAKFKKTDTKELFKKFQLPRGTLNVLFVGRLHPEKSVDTLIKSIPLVLRRQKNVHFLIVGFGHMDNQLKNLAKKIGVSDQVTFFDEVSNEDLLMAYNVCDIFVLPSLAELEGMVVLEAMACGKPIIIANSINSASTYFVEGNGFLFEPENEKDLARKTLKLLTDAKLRKKMGAVSLKKSRDYDIHHSVAKLEEVYYSV
ncbi:glycosyltransferase [Candidatus Gracilibacteria bacterium]|nr:glycosyltransferase [Candidatus Gracilibacteria bacterium]MCF7856196.1 glycosyltransferase [Candidatus Gracilibacteria bacterium]MCF7896468.1 glycosyltransferase [Candidatus Gracilibacteria bacterium]